MIYLMNELSHKSGSMYELTHGYEILFMPPKVIILSHAMSYHLEKRCTHVMMYFYAMIFTFRVKLEPKLVPREEAEGYKVNWSQLARKLPELKRSFAQH